MAFSLFNPLQAQLLDPIRAATDVSSTLVMWLTPLIAIAVTIRLIVHGFSVAHGMGGNLFMDIVARVARPFAVCALALAGGMYANNVVGILSELRTDLTNLYGPQAANSYVTLDLAVESVAKTLMGLIPAVTKNISFIPVDFTGIVLMLAMLGIMGGTLFYALVAAINLVVLDAGLAILFGIGPLFVAGLAFQSTARFFDTWLSAVLKYTLTAVFLAMTLGVTTNIISKLAANFSKTTDVFDLVSLSMGFIGTAVLLVGLLFKSATIAAELTGGISLNLVSSASVANAAKPAVNAAGYAAGAAVGVAARGVSAAGGMAAGTSLGARVLKATESMRSSAGSGASAAATGFRNFGSAVGGRQGVGGAFDIGRNAASRSTGHGTVTGNGRPIPHVKD